MQTVVRDVCQLWLSYLQLELQGISVDIFLEEWTYEAYHSELQQLHQKAFSTFNTVVTYQVVFDSVATGLLSLL